MIRIYDNFQNFNAVINFIILNQSLQGYLKIFIFLNQKDFYFIKITEFLSLVIIT